MSHTVCAAVVVTKVTRGPASLNVLCPPVVQPIREGKSLVEWMAAALPNITHQMSALQSKLDTLKTRTEIAKVGTLKAHLIKSAKVFLRYN